MLVPSALCVEAAEQWAVQRAASLPDDLFRHRILGLGTGDFMIKPAHEPPFEIHNVWRARRKQRRMEAMIAKRVMETARAD